MSANNFLFLPLLLLLPNHLHLNSPYDLPALIWDYFLSGFCSNFLYILQADLALVKAVQDWPLWNLELHDQVWYGNTKAAVEHIRHIHGSQWAASRNNHEWQWQNQNLLPTAQTYKHTFKNTIMTFHIKFETVFRNFKFAYQTWLPAP